MERTTRYTDCEAQSDYPGMGKLSSACRIQAGFLTHGSHDLPHNLAVGKSPPSEEKHAVDQAKILHAIWAPRLWFFASKDAPEQGHTPYRLFHANSIPIVRHTLVHSGLNPYDPKWFSYMEKRTGRYPVQIAPTFMGVS